MFLYNRMTEKKILHNVNCIVQILIKASSLNEKDKGDLIDQAVSLLIEIRPGLYALLEGREHLMSSLARQLITQKLPHPYLLNSFGDLQKDLNRVIALALFPAKEESEEERTKTAGNREAEEPVIPVINENNYENKKEQPIYNDIENTADGQTICEEANDLDNKVVMERDDTDNEALMEPDDLNDMMTGEPLIEENSNSESNPAGDQCLNVPAAEAVTLPARNDEKNKTPVYDAASGLNAIIRRLYSSEVILSNHRYRSFILDFYFPEKKTALILVQPHVRQRIKLYKQLLKNDDIVLIEIEPSDLQNSRHLLRKLPRL